MVIMIVFLDRRPGQPSRIRRLSSSSEPPRISAAISKAFIYCSCLAIGTSCSQQLSRPRKVARWSNDWRSNGGVRNENLGYEVFEELWTGNRGMESKQRLGVKVMESCENRDLD